ncbi:HAMP domain-containing histidine kinase, partial [Parabacteroides sp. OttesenSCG-928-G07]|nr:HAMP domain-containing histidine kinase [Parabacteroides sp. OttesenSCG-928-G07]
MKKRGEIIIALLLSTLSLFAQDPNDSISLTIQSLPASEKLPYLENLAKRSINEEAYFSYLEEYRKTALNQKDTTHLNNALYLYANYYYSKSPDSMRYWLNIAEPLFVQGGRYEDICRMKAWNIYNLSRELKRTEVLSAVEELKTFSENIGFPEGKEMADQALADFYFANNLSKEAETLYLDVYRRMEERNSPLIKRINILRQLFNRMPKAEDRLKYLQMTEKYLNECKLQGMTEFDPENPIHILEYTVTRNYANEYVLSEQFDQAWTYLQKSEALIQEHNMRRRQNELYTIYVNYYKRKHEYAKALDYINRMEEVYRERNSLTYLYNLLESKASVLKELKQYDESLAIYNELLTLKDSINHQDFYEQLANVRTRYEVEQLELEMGQTAIKAERANYRMLLSVGSSVLLLVVILILILHIRTVMRNKKELHIAKEKAEDADRMKSAFLANMNHEIRTPLNAIVGFSQVIVEEENIENRREFADIIQNNNELLQRLIGDVLDISKIESNSMSLIYSQQDLPLLMREIYNMIFLRMPVGVELILDPCKPFVFETDRNRLVQILTNILTNAIKHTKQGYIRFGFKTDLNDIQFYVEDSGEGIPEDQLSSIFDRFVQLENGEKGVGLGLAICKGLVTKMGG